MAPLSFLLNHLAELKENASEDEKEEKEEETIAFRSRVTCSGTRRTAVRRRAAADEREHRRCSRNLGVDKTVKVFISSKITNTEQSVARSMSFLSFVVHTSRRRAAAADKPEGHAAEDEKEEADRASGPCDGRRPSNRFRDAEHTLFSPS